jgi:hypothetical protein
MTDLTHVSDADRRAMARQAASADDLRQILSDDGLEYLVCARVGAARVDLLLAETDYQRLAIDRAVDGVLTVEDVIVHKLIAGRSSAIAAGERRWRIGDADSS